jgi:hypothetical protein
MNFNLVLVRMDLYWSLSSEIMRKSKNTKSLIAERYGKEGTKEREKFREDAFSFYFGEIIENRS